jgi:hypothetical protein
MARGHLDKLAETSVGERAIARLKDRKEIKAPTAAFTERALMSEQPAAES